ncbi:hypothetical protein PINS_up007149 [Pythium insidiosum]|nr:hypothetical protein PINS_up007149 [Pythium insidiosum]
MDALGFVVEQDDDVIVTGGHDPLANTHAPNAHDDETEEDEELQALAPSADGHAHHHHPAQDAQYQQQQQQQEQQHSATGSEQHQHSAAAYGAAGYGYGYGYGGGDSSSSHAGASSVAASASTPTPGKLFIGGVSWETTEDGLRSHFGKYGALTDAALMKDKFTGQPRGFGFVTFADASVIDRVLEEAHVIDGRTVEVKRAIPRDKTAPAPSEHRGGGSGGGHGGYGRSGTFMESKKIFVGWPRAVRDGAGFPPVFRGVRQDHRRRRHD